MSTVSCRTGPAGVSTSRGLTGSRMRRSGIGTPAGGVDGVVPGGVADPLAVGTTPAVAGAAGLVVEGCAGLEPGSIDVSGADDCVDADCVDDGLPDVVGIAEAEVVGDPPVTDGLGLAGIAGVTLADSAERGESPRAFVA